MRLSVASRTVIVSAKDAIGKGGEADVYALGNGTALKVFKGPKDADYAGDPDAQEGARRRLLEHQDKLPAFPHLPPSVVVPIDLAYNGTKKIVGYTMDYLKGWEVLLRYGDRRFREQGGVDPNDVVEVFLHLAAVVNDVHRAGATIGDFNDLNVLVHRKEVRLIDADSFQFDRFLCKAFTARFLDPRASASDHLELVRAHDLHSDWYAFAVMLFQSLLYVGPYGGVHRPKSGPRFQHDQRVLRRLTVFDPDVIYPKPAIPYGYLPDDLLDYFHEEFEKDVRNAVPERFLANLCWTTCSNCGTVHARPSCPACRTYVRPEPVVVRGSVKAKRVFATEGQIVCAAYQGKLLYLYHERENAMIEAFRRENGHVVVRGPLRPELRYRISGDHTLLGGAGRMLVFDMAISESAAGGHREEIDTYGHLPVIDANSRAWYWVDPVGQLQKANPSGFGRAVIGNVLEGQTLFWVGEKFGFGFYRAGELTRAFVFDDRGMNDQVSLDRFAGKLVDTTCVFSERHAWFFATMEEGGRLRNHVYLVDRGGVADHRSVEQVEDDWLASGIRGRFAAGQDLYVPTAEGVVRVDADDLGRIAKSFPDTEAFVDETSYLLQGDGGIYVVGTNEITHLTIT